MGTRNEPLSITAMRLSNPDRSPLRIHGCDTAPTPTGFAEIVSDDFPILEIHHAGRCRCLTDIFISVHVFGGDDGRWRRRLRHFLDHKTMRHWTEIFRPSALQIPRFRAPIFIGDDRFH
jgi:hypothetical protein